MAGNPLAADASQTWLMDAINGTDVADVIRVTRGQNSATVSVNGASYAVDLASLPELLIRGSGGDDQIVLDLTGVAALPAGGVVVDGGGGSDRVSVDGGAVAFRSSQDLASLAIRRGAVVSLTPGGDLVLRTNVLDLDNGTLDIADHTVIVDYTGASPLAALRGRIASGRNTPAGGIADGTWTGIGIRSSAAAAAFLADGVETRAVGLVENASLPFGPYATFAGQAVDNTAVLIGYTRNGDTNLDGVVDDIDATIVGALYDGGASSGHQWYEGDFNFDGLIDDLDATILGAFYAPEAMPLSRADAPSAARAADDVPLDGHDLVPNTPVATARPVPPDTAAPDGASPLGPWQDDLLA